MPGFLSPGKGMPLLLIPEYLGINKGQRFPDRSETAHTGTWWHRDSDPLLCHCL